MPDVSQSVADAFNAKLEAFNESLNEEEQELLGSLIAQAAAGADSDVTGFAFAAASPNLSYGGNQFVLRTNPINIGLGNFKAGIELMAW